MRVMASVYVPLKLSNSGYIAGSGDGIVTVKGVPSARNIYLLDAMTMQLLSHNQSLKNGRYLFVGLDPSREYLVMVRDYKRELEPFAWDYVKPANDLTIGEQQTMWVGWQ